MNNARQTKVREVTLRRIAERRGFELHKSRRRDPLAPDYGKWTVTDRSGAPLAVGYSLEEIEDAVNRLSESHRQAA